MPETLRPDSEEGVVEAVRAAAADRAPLRIDGGGSKRGFGRPVQAARDLSLAGLTGITLYAPEELVISARAGTPMAEIEATLAERGQQLAFEPPDWRGLFGGEGAGEPTVGGVVSCNLSGPRRIATGAARDQVLGLRAVTGRGEAIRAGGRVVKNVTGYDLCKLLTGAFGTLGVLTEVTLKVRPAGETQATVLLLDGDPLVAAEAMSAALGSPWEVSAAAHLPPAASRCVASAIGGARAVTALRLEGFAPSVAARAGRLRQSLGRFGETALLDAGASARLWAAVRDLEPFRNDPRALWRVSVAPTEGPAFAAEVSRRIASDALYDWGGGLVWIAVPASDDAGGDAGAAAVRGALEGRGGHATLVRAPEAVRAAVPVFQPQPAPLAALSARLKHAFDPHRLLNPGRMDPEL